MYAEPIRIVQVHYPKAAMHAVGGAIALVPLLLPSVRDIFALAIVVGGSMLVNITQAFIISPGSRHSPR